MAVEILKRRFTVDDYHRMAEAGILSDADRVELIDGEIVRMSPIGPRHMACVDRVNRLFVLAAQDTAIVHIQSSLRLDQHNELEPDVVLLRPQADFYASRMPGPADTFLVIEVGQSSLDYDIHVKAPLYAAAGVPEYWILDLTENRLIRHLDPSGARYESVDPHAPSEVVAPYLLSHCHIRVGDLLGL